MFRGRRRTWSFHVAVLQRTPKKCTKIYNARAQKLFCSLNLLFGDVLIAVIVVVYLSFLISAEVGEWSRWLYLSYVESKNINLTYCHIEKECIETLKQDGMLIQM